MSDRQNATGVAAEPRRSVSERIAIDSIVIGERHRKDLGDLEQLAHSIAEEGLLQPIGITAEGVLVFGERRLRACKNILGWTEIDARVVNVSSIAGGEYAENEMRKDLTPSERVAITDAVRTEIGNWQGRRTDLVPAGESDAAKHVGSRPQVDPGEKTRDAAAKIAGFGSDREYRRAKTVVATGTPELVAQMDAGKIPISTAAAARETPEVQNCAVEKVKQGKRAPKALAEAKREKAATGTPPLPGNRYEAIVCDPPWPTNPHGD